MARFSGDLRTTGAGTTTLPACALQSSANYGFILREIAVANTTATACVYRLVRLSTAGTPGTSQTEAEWDEDGPAPADVGISLNDTYTGTAPITTPLGVRFSLGGGIGSAQIRGFGGPGIRCQPGTANGIGVLLASGTGQILDVDFIWEVGG